MLGFQGSLLDDLTGAEIAVGPPAPERTLLSRGAWVDLQQSWVGGADALFDHLLHGVPWRAERRQMYDRKVDVPRMLAFYDGGQPLPHPSLVALRESLTDHYARELGEPFVTAGLCLYRDGRDSVAWHGDRIGRGRSADTMVAIVSVGSPRWLALRPAGGGGASRRYALGHGDLIVMGGSCQRTWEHAVAKTARPTGPRISIQFRPRDVR